MKIAVLSTYDLQGGAAISAYRLHHGLRNHGQDSIMFVQSKSSHDTSVCAESNSWNRQFNQFRPALDRLALYPSSACGTYSTGLLSNRRALSKIRGFAPDVVHLQWINGGFFSLANVSHLNLPIVWRLPDWWLLTAGCHLPYDCERYKQDCAHCPRLGQQKLFDRSAWLLNWKRLRINKIRNIKFVAPSYALAADAARSRTLADADIRVIPNGLDLTVFKPLDQTFSRRALNLPLNEKIVLFGAVNGRNDPNKGYSSLLQALARVSASGHTPFSCVTFGMEAGLERHGDVHIRSIGVLCDEQSMNLLYSAADVMVVPSYQESFGQTAIEAMACGTPVVAFKTTGLLDIVDSGHNGYLAEKFDVEDLAHGISSILEHSSPNELSAHSRAKVNREFNINSVVGRYMALYEEVIEESGTEWHT